MEIQSVKKIIIICGPTGIGKTGFAIELARRFNGEIIGADSMQIYKYMDIGTAKPDKAERELAPHHLVDFLEPDKEFDAGRYMEMADGVIDDICSRSKIPIVVGGTGLYIKALLHGLFRDRNADANVIARLEREKEEKGSHFLHERLSVLDPESANRIHPNDAFRIVRALEVVEVTGNPISTFQNKHGFSPQRYIPLKIALYMDRSELYRRIEKRVDMMMEQGFLDEVGWLIEKGYGCDLKSMQSIGYRHVCDLLYDRASLDDTVRLLKRDTRRYAKRQLTWFRQDMESIWLAPEAIDQAEEIIKHFLG
ncbi:MAG: tRNA (adenosine(37)-N6)-dimethylallyltransferase MiaA [Desulfamplus sp.]|nr:tRNA (adenosine(37)-N6)-dimethylallyltransferase MiaA [Desulfamplus sp.]MBF0259054.1 tRNA (adenosine(37)-N6)-dimethylallyltransferase MiaA [Desulfamplus sp.]